VLRDLREQGITDVKFYPTDTMIADMMIKPLQKDSLRNLADAIQIKFE
jgi:hypothetical protein